ncbi:hypothetical protein [Brucella intermedia]|uniref:hypothetical protein n=1 Tax=Brucella intermedia TaxID=94625 RepID=UPI002361DF38|nr:hypothetical protein [Brucella intermedia]
MLGIGTLLGGAQELISNAGAQADLDAVRAAADQQRHMDTAMSIQQSAIQHDQNRFDMQLETMRSLTNDATKKATEISADAGAILKDTAQKLDSSSSA